MWYTCYILLYWVNIFIFSRLRRPSHLSSSSRTLEPRSFLLYGERPNGPPGPSISRLHIQWSSYYPPEEYTSATADRYRYVKRSVNESLFLFSFKLVVDKKKKWNTKKGRCTTETVYVFIRELMIRISHHLQTTDVKVMSANDIFGAHAKNRFTKNRSAHEFVNEFESEFFFACLI